MTGVADWTGLLTIRQGAHVKIVRPDHVHYRATGTVIRVDPVRRQVWIALPGGGTTRASNRSIEVIVPGTSNRVE